VDDVVMRRVIGALALLCVALALVTFLPQPSSPDGGDAGVRKVTIDLAAPPPAPKGPAAPASNVPPPSVAAPMPAAPRPEEEEPAPVVEAPPAPPPAAVAAETPRPPASSPTPAATKVASVVETPPPPKPASPKEVLPKQASPKEPVPKDAAPKDATPKEVAKPVETPKEAPKPPSPAPVAKTAPTGAWLIQVGSFLDLTNAHVTQDRLKAAGYDSIISPLDTAKGTLYRVRAGPFASKDAALGAKPKVVALGFPQSTLVGK
jgi:DedD protein